ncbi:hypothetical protein J6590_022601 [Homalodisca vitripennis]|nr:hypothetical protein J6590_022601 [Homalodisca vitripennis]
MSITLDQSSTELSIQPADYYTALRSAEQSRVVSGDVDGLLNVNKSKQPQSPWIRVALNYQYNQLITTQPCGVQSRVEWCQSSTELSIQPADYYTALRSAEQSRVVSGDVDGLLNVNNSKQPQSPWIRVALNYRYNQLITTQPCGVQSRVEWCQVALPQPDQTAAPHPGQQRCETINETINRRSGAVRNVAVASNSLFVITSNMPTRPDTPYSYLLHGGYTVHERIKL